jgi:hypothetical protein
LKRLKQWPLTSVRGGCWIDYQEELPITALADQAGSRSQSIRILGALIEAARRSVLNLTLDCIQPMNRGIRGC